jgi:exopolysaccharide biosynthesis polyprenyl glycosylphosphotransferase
VRHKSDLIFSAALVVADFVALLAAFVAAYTLRVKLDPRPLADPVAAVTFLKIFLIILPFWILIFAWQGLYHDQHYHQRLQEFLKIIMGCAGGVMLVIVADFLSAQPLFPARLVPVYGVALSVAFVTTERQFMHWLRRYLYRFNIGIKHVVVVGDNGVTKQIVEALKHTKTSGIRIAAVVSNNYQPAKIKHYNDFATFAKKFSGHADEIVQTHLYKADEQNHVIMWYARQRHLGYRFYPTPSDIYSANHTIELTAGLPMIVIRQTPLEGWGRIIKRLFDVVGASVGIIISLPIILVLAAAIKLTDPSGPVLYKHKRLSRFGKPFYIYKLRSMYWQYSTGDFASKKSDAEIFRQMGRPDLIEEFKAEQKLTNDPRVMPVGRLVRATSLDEVPQLLNVLSGKLSLVGPRAIVEDELARYGNERAAFLSIKPGITGLWQVSGRSNISYKERIELELYYVQNWNMLLDIKILFKTAAAVIRKTGAK